MKTSFVKKTGIVLGWIILWSVLVLIINNDIVLVGPVQIILALVHNACESEFYLSILMSLLRIMTGFVAGLLVGGILGIVGYKVKLVKDILEPFMVTIKAIPVASFVVLLLIWAGSSKLSFFISFLMVLPQIYTSMVAGLESVDPLLIEMADGFNYNLWEKAVYVYKDSVSPFLESAVKISIGLAWKSGVAAEVIGLSDHSLGSRIYMSKIYLDTANLFAYTLVVILLSFFFEKLVILLLHKVTIIGKPVTSGGNQVAVSDGNQVAVSGGITEGVSDGKTETVKRRMDESNQDSSLDNYLDLILNYPRGSVEISDINVSFGDKEVLRNYSLSLEDSESYLLMGESGVGKTTLLNEIRKRSKKSISMVFQENRLLEEYDAVTNIVLGHRNLSKDDISSIAKMILPYDCLEKPVKELSGGMKRRVAVLRAMLFESELLLLDEPFTGIDEENKDRVIELIKLYQRNRTLLVVSHDSEDARGLEASIIEL